MRSVRAIAAEQGGIVARAQLLAAGVRRRRSGVRCARAGCTALHRGVYSAVAPELLTEEGHLVAALLAAGEGAILSHGTAAWRWRIIPAPPSVMQLAVPRPRTAPRGVQLHVSWAPAPRRHDDQRPLPDHDRRAHAARPRRPLRPPRAAARAGRGRVPPRPAARRHRAHAAPRAPGQRQPARRAGRPRPRPRRGQEPARAPLPPAPRSAAASSCRERNAAVGPWTVDCLWPNQRVVVELDGGQHDRPHQADVDRDRDLWLRARGYPVRRYGHRQIDERPDDVIADLLDALGG